MDESVLKSLFQGHHVITKDVANKSQLLVTLEEFDLFELNASQNILNLPGTQELAEKLNLSPHTGGPLSSYQKGINDLVDDLADTEDGQAAIAGDRAAAERVAGRVNTLRDTLKTALINGDLFTNTPKGITSEAINKLNQELLGKLDDYATKHADAISKMGKLVGPEAEWTAVLKSSEAVEEVTKALQKAGKTGALDSLGAAIGQATEVGRFSPSVSLRETLGSIFGASARGLVKGLGAAGLGAAGALLDAKQSMAQAKELAANGDVEGANSVLNGLGARLAFGWMGAQWGGSAGVGAGPYGALIGVVLGGATGVIGGEAAVKAIEKAAKEISEALGLSSGEVTLAVSVRQPETILNPDGTKTITEFNPENNQPSSIKTYDKDGKLKSQTETEYDPLTHVKTRESVFDGSGKQINDKYFDRTTGKETSETTFKPDGTGTTTSYDASNNSPWREAKAEYDVNGILVSERRLNDDGSTWETTFFPGTTRASTRSEYNAAGNLTKSSTFRTDGTKAVTLYDVTGTGTWKEALIEYRKDGSPISETGINNDGSTYDAVFDKDTGEITRRRVYTADGKPISTITIHTDGTQSVTLYDAANKANRREATIDYDKNGKPVSHKGINDDGSSYDVKYDPSSGAMTARTDYNDKGQTLSATIFRTDGTKVKKLYDAGGTGVWKEASIEYRTDGSLVLETGINDDGSKYDVVFDKDTGEVTRRREYTADGKPTAIITFRQDGTQSKTLYDAGNKGIWREATIDYGKNGNAVSERGIKDDGSSYDVKFNPASGAMTARTDYNDKTQALSAAIFRDDGTKAITLYDVTGTGTWKEALIEYRKDGSLVSETGINDDGSKYDVVFDKDTGEVTRRREYTADGKPTAIITFRQDGTQSKTLYDVNNKATWREATIDYDKNGNAFSEKGIKDNGGSYEVKYDPTSGAMTARTDYSDKGQTLSKTTFRTDGTKLETLYDADGTGTWKEASVEYRKDGSLVSETGTNDDGSKYDVDFDKNTGKIMRRREYTADGKPTAIITFRQDGTRDLYSYDKFGKPVLDIRYDKNGAVIYDRLAVEKAAEAMQQLEQALEAEATRIRLAEESSRKASSGRKDFSDGTYRITEYDTSSNQQWARKDTYYYYLQGNSYREASLEIFKDGTSVTSVYERINKTERGKKIFGQTTWGKDGNILSSTGKYGGLLLPGMPFSLKPFEPRNMNPLDTAGEAWRNAPAAPIGAGSFSAPPPPRYPKGGTGTYGGIDAAQPPAGLGGGGGSTGGGGPVLGSGPFPISGPPTTGIFTGPPAGGWGNPVWGNKVAAPTSFLPSIFPEGHSASVSKLGSSGASPLSKISLPAIGSPVLLVDITDDNKVAVYQDANGIFFIKRSGSGTGPAPIGPKVGEGTFVPMPDGFVSSGGLGISYRGPVMLQGREFLLYENSNGNVIAVPVKPLVLDISGKPSVVPPVALDLDGNGEIELKPLDPANQCDRLYDWTDDGISDHTVWVGPKDGFLAVDLGSDGQIDQPKELAFSLWKTDGEIEAEDGQSVTDIEGLRYAFDTNRDNVLDANDARWNEFRVWQDLNQNGVSEVGELRNMSEAGIKLINLLPDLAGAKQFSDGSAITGTATAIMTDGSTMMIADASLRFQPSMPTHLLS